MNNSQSINELIRSSTLLLAKGKATPEGALQILSASFSVDDPTEKSRIINLAKRYFERSIQMAKADDIIEMIEGSVDLTDYNIEVNDIDAATAEVIFTDDDGGIVSVMVPSELDFEDEDVIADIFSTAMNEIPSDEEFLGEAFITRVLGGKAVKIQIKRKKKRRLNSKQKAALAKARKKANSSSAKRKRAKSMDKRKRLGL